MKTLFIFLFAFIISSCSNNIPRELLIDTKNDEIVHLLGQRVEVVTIDHCEYLFIRNIGITHKGNCKNH